MDHITIENLQVFAHHGVFPEETALGQKFLVTATLGLHTRCAGRTDDLSQSIDYGAVSQEITAFLQQHTYQLIEAAAEQLAEHLLLKYDLLQTISLRIQKPWAPVGLPLDTVAVEITRGWHTAYIALGSNMGDKRAYLDGAVQMLNETPRVCVQRVSEYLVTEPYGMTEQEEFLNGCLCLDTLLTPQELLELLHDAEQRAGRERLVHWGPRTLDLDILFYDDRVLWEDDLVIPHPEIAKRMFVLQPMAQIAPYFVHPVTRQTMRQMLDALIAE